MRSLPPTPNDLNESPPIVPPRKNLHETMDSPVSILQKPLTIKEISITLHTERL